jgi:hypothetical protein
MSDEVLEVDPQLSWARRVRDEVSIQLRLLGAALEPGTAAVELVSRSGRLRSLADVRAVAGVILVSFSVPQSELGRSTWRLAIQTPSGQFVPLLARLVAASTSPVALLPGPAPATRMRPPTPRGHRPPDHRLAGRLPAPARSVLVRARTWGREAVGRKRR